MFKPATKPTLFDTAAYFQQQADRTRDPERKAHYQRCADQYRAEARQAESTQPEKRWATPSVIVL